MDNLRLRIFRDDDFEAFHAMCSDYDVVKLVSSWPYPADAEFNRMRMNTPEAKSGLVSVIECDEQFAGTIGGIQGVLGYMLAKRFWGSGIATWAVQRKLKEGIEIHKRDKIEASSWFDNPASSAVLLKNGFREINRSTESCKARASEIESINYAITRNYWLETNQSVALG